MNRCRPSSFGDKFFLALLALSVLVNGTQAVVLCISVDGHAVKLAAHRHCEYAHDSQETAAGTAAFAANRDTCSPCEDVPLSSGISDRPGVEQTPEMTALAYGIVPPVPEMADPGLEVYTAGACPAFISFYDPIRSIILIV